MGWIRSYGRLVGAAGGGGEAGCGFGQAGALELCEWEHSNLSSLHFTLSSGLNSNWLGGPPEDGNDDKEGECHLWSDKVFQLD